MSFIQVNNLTKHYRLGDNTVHALRGVSLNVKKGERLFLGGPSGSGKSTLLHIIGCLDKYDNGNVTIGGKDITLTNDREMSDFRARNIGFVFQNFNLMPVLNVFENVQYPLLLNRSIPYGQRRKQVQTILEAVGLIAHAGHFPNELSGGQRQRVAIARALVHEPQLLIADEPTANLDSTTGTAIMELMLNLSLSHGSTVIICTHNPELLAGAERCIMLRDGLVTNDSTTQTKRGNVYACI
ncbi:ABC transporter ATP-binding protein [Methylicorpusculum oleiharenae]|uniref:ABC transporter ATP-binding protein n=1 Tax=Methylicorpusculum oleiharenae TaxID=1338687 RepID=UPI001358F3ED|nr:ABC transporter ATP-binding protein [Methylicorpusculum oleiharenae]MCD2451455.1 ABC transporter ATP-binding protein [Methylicorpusculum oleiharenae]